MTKLEELIKEMEEQIDSDDYEEVQEKCMFEIEEANLGIDAVEPLLSLMERHPLSDFGMPGAIVHYVERFYKNGYFGQTGYRGRNKKFCERISFINKLDFMVWEK